VKEIAILQPPGLALSGQKIASPEEAAMITMIEVPDLAGVTIDSSSISADG